MRAPYVVVDVFTEQPLAGNALAVFPEPGTVPPDRMQAIAREMNLSETTFVTGIDGDSYDVRIFTPYAEMPFAGHPTLGTAWSLWRGGALSGTDATQHSAGGATPVRVEGDRVWLRRSGRLGPAIDPGDIAARIGVEPGAIGMEASIFGARATLEPAVADAGVPVVIVPFADAAALAALVPRADLHVDADGVYCIAPLANGRVKARFFAPELGVFEDPATGAAAAALGVYVGANAGPASFVIEQGAEIRRPSRLHVEAAADHVRVGGNVVAVAEGVLTIA